ncbi:MAG TPA: hypothetical protein VK095_06300 [Beutenbergiaceae bacterium]|nr:hypothetical protein [Beutenbergiaceae bacterium]
MSDSARPPEPPEGLDLGPGPHPGTAAEWESRLRQAMDRLLQRGAPAAGELDAVDLQVVAGSPPDLASVEVELSGVHIGIEQVQQASAERDLFRPTDPQPIDAGRIGTLVIQAAPLLVADIPVHLHLRAERVPVQWVRDDRDNLWAVEDTRTELGEVSGEGELRAPTDQVIAVLRERVRTELAAEGLTLSEFDLQLSTPRPGHLHAVVDTTVRKGVLSASVQLRTRVSIDHQMVLTVQEVTATSRNPLVGLLLRILRGRVAAFGGTRVDLNDRMPPGLHVLDVDLSVDTELRARARFG